MIAIAQPADWPIVAPDDDGIRPAGRPDQCFYCHRKVGELHGDDCVTILKEVEYAVMFDGECVGTFRRDTPYSWTIAECVFHLNDSSWCVDNAWDGIQWEPGAETRVRQRVDEHGGGCACGVLKFEYRSITKPGPYQKRE